MSTSSSAVWIITGPSNLLGESHLEIANSPALLPPLCPPPLAQEKALAPICCDALVHLTQAYLARGGDDAQAVLPRLKMIGQSFPLGGCPFPSSLRHIQMCAHVECCCLQGEGEGGRCARYSVKWNDPF